MFHGGSNSKGKKVRFLNENVVPKISYDFQAALGEFGQLRDSYGMLKLQNILYKDFEDLFCHTKAVLSEESKGMDEHDNETLWYAVRMNEQSTGFLFINNYQNHIETKD